MSFWNAIFGGQNATLSGDMNKFGQIGGFATGMGEQNLTASSAFNNAILSGDATKQYQALAPEINAAKTSASQNNKTAAMFGPRSGGTAASTAATSDKVHSDITNMIGSLTGGAANTLASTGSSLLGTGLTAYSSQQAASQQQLQNWKTSILGAGTADLAQTGLNAAEGAAGL